MVVCLGNVILLRFVQRKQMGGWLVGEEDYIHIYILMTKPSLPGFWLGEGQSLLPRNGLRRSVDLASPKLTAPDAV